MVVKGQSKVGQGLEKRQDKREREVVGDAKHKQRTLLLPPRPDLTSHLAQLAGVDGPGPVRVDLVEEPLDQAIAQLEAALLPYRPLELRLGDRPGRTL